MNTDLKLESMKLFKDAFIYDGTGADGFRGDILVENDRIVKVDKCINPEEGWEVIELNGLSVSPGFIDAHSKSIRCNHDIAAVINKIILVVAPFIIV